LKKFKIKIFADGANIEDFFLLNKIKFIDGFTTNPTLMRSAGVKNYKIFAHSVLSRVKKKPISFEVFADDFVNMEKQAVEIGKWGPNVVVKIPITNTKGLSCSKLIGKLSQKKIICNVTAIFTIEQIQSVLKFINKDTKIIFSVFAGRLADIGRDPEVLMKKAKKIIKRYSNAKLLWASTREVFNIFQAERCGCDIITVPNELLKKLKFLEKDPVKFSKETVQMFFLDAKKANYSIN
jgi:transaldolase